MKQGSAATFRLATIVSLGGFLFGFDASVISGVVKFVVPQFHLTEWQQGFAVGAPTFAAIFAGLAVGPLSDWIGRKKVLIIVAFLYTLSAVFSAMAQGFWSLVLARAIGGAAFGSLVLAPLYIAEISPPSLRGIMVSINQLNIVIGFSIAYFSNLYFLRASQSGAAWVHLLHIDSEPWRWMLGVEALPAFGYFLWLFLIPESPRWLVVQGRLKEATRILSRVLRPDEVGTSIAEIRASIAEEGAQTKSRIRELLRPELRLALLVAFIVAVAQQITGVNAIYFYAPTIFEQSGVGTDAAFAQAVWVGIINVVFTVVAMLLIDRIGRKPLLILGLCGVMVSMAVASYGFKEARYELSTTSISALPAGIDHAKLQPLAGVSYPDDVAYKNALRQTLGTEVVRAHDADLVKAGIHTNPFVILAGILGFVASFAISLGPVMWVLLSEIFPNRIRGLTISVVTFINSGVSFLVQMFFPWELTRLGDAWTFAIYGFFAAASLLLIIWLLPETKGRTLEQLEHEFSLGRRRRAPAIDAPGTASGEPLPD